MTRERPRRRSASRSQGPYDASTAPFRLLKNPWRPLEVISIAELDRLHEASMRIVEDIGIEFLETVSQTANPALSNALNRL